MRNRRVFSGFFFLGSLLSFSQESAAKPELLSASFPKNKKVSKVLPPEYQTWIRVKPRLSQVGSLVDVENIEREILHTRMESESRVLDKELDEAFFVFELRRAERLVDAKKWKKAMESFQRGYLGLQNTKLPFYWWQSTSAALSTLCKRNYPPAKLAVKKDNKKEPKQDETCLALARKIVDVFPKAAKETKVLRELPSIDASPGSDLSTERLSMSYTEKVEKDEEAFQAVLQAFLNPKDADVLKLGKEFIEQFPRSILRYRTQFLMAEFLTKKGEPEDAKPFYQVLLQETPLSFYAVVAAERTGQNLRDRVKKDPLVIDRDSFLLSLGEKRTLERIQQLFDLGNYEEVALEADAFSRNRNYSNDFVFYLMAMLTRAQQNLGAFRLGNELIQRRYDGVLNAELLEMLFPERYTKEIETHSIQNRIDPLLILSLMKQESGFKASALSSSGALGLMQLMPFTAIDVDQEIFLKDLKDPNLNIRLGTQYLASLMEKFNQNAVFALAGYNAGPHRVNKWRKEGKPEVDMIEFIESIPFKETREYVMSILRNRYWYQFRKGYPPKSVFEYWIKVNPT